MAGALPGPVRPEVSEQGHGHVRRRRHGHGHDAHAPHRIPPRGWLQVLGRAGRHVLDDRLMALAAAVSFFAILSIAPLLVTALSVYGAVNTPEQALDQLSSVAEVLPPELEPLVAEQLTTITTASAQVLTWRGLTGLVAALVTATTAATYLIDALTLAYSETETRGFLRRTGLAAVFVLGGALVLGAVIAGTGALSRQLSRLPDPLPPGLLDAGEPRPDWSWQAVVLIEVTPTGATARPEFTGPGPSGRVALPVPVRDLLRTDPP